MDVRCRDASVDGQVGWRPLWCQGGLGGRAKAAGAFEIDVIKPSSSLRRHLDNVPSKQMCSYGNKIWDLQPAMLGY